MSSNQSGTPSSTRKSKTSTPSSSKRSKFTTTMQDRQARGKDPRTGRASSDNDSDSAQPAKKPSRVSSADDAYESAERRKWASTILDTPELLMMHAVSRGDSIPGTRQHFMRILCGYEEKREEGKDTRKDPKKEDKAKKGERRRKSGGTGLGGMS